MLAGQWLSTLLFHLGDSAGRRAAHWGKSLHDGWQRDGRHLFPRHLWPPTVRVRFAAQHCWGTLHQRCVNFLDWCTCLFQGGKSCYIWSMCHYLIRICITVCAFLPTDRSGHATPVHLAQKKRSNSKCGCAACMQNSGGVSASPADQHLWMGACLRESERQHKSMPACSQVATPPAKAAALEPSWSKSSIK